VQRIAGEHASTRQRQAERIAELAAAETASKAAAERRTAVEADVEARVKRWATGKNVRQMLASLNQVKELSALALKCTIILPLL
jgi:hypothetical protein